MKSFITKICVAFNLLLPINSLAQHQGSIEYLKKSPLTKGFIMLRPQNHFTGRPSDNIRIYSREGGKVYSVRRGIVTNVFNSFDSTNIIITKSQDTFFCIRWIEKHNFEKE